MVICRVVNPLLWSVTWSMSHTHELLQCTHRHTIIMQCISYEYDTLNLFGCNHTNHIARGSTPKARDIPLHPTPTHTLTSTTARCPFWAAMQRQLKPSLCVRKRRSRPPSLTSSCGDMQSRQSSRLVCHVVYVSYT